MINGTDSFKVGVSVRSYKGARVRCAKGIHSRVMRKYTVGVGIGVDDEINSLSIFYVLSLLSSSCMSPVRYPVLFEPRPHFLCWKGIRACVFHG